MRILLLAAGECRTALATANLRRRVVELIGRGRIQGQPVETFATSRYRGCAVPPSPVRAAGRP